MKLDGIAGLIATAAVALVLGYLVGRVRQAVVVLVHVLVRPRTSWHILHTPDTEARVPVPVRDPDWVNRRTGDKGGAA